MLENGRNVRGPGFNRSQKFDLRNFENILSHQSSTTLFAPKTHIFRPRLLIFAHAFLQPFDGALFRKRKAEALDRARVELRLALGHALAENFALGGAFRASSG